MGDYRVKLRLCSIFYDAYLAYCTMCAYFYLLFCESLSRIYVHNFIILFQCTKLTLIIPLWIYDIVSLMLLNVLFVALFYFFRASISSIHNYRDFLMYTLLTWSYCYPIATSNILLYYLSSFLFYLSCILSSFLANLLFSLYTATITLVK